jgi:hypothetical protein
MLPPTPMSMTDQSSPEAQYASLLRNWITSYGQLATQAVQYVDVAYARGYLQSWDQQGTGGVSPEDLNAIIDLLNEFKNEYAGDDATLVNRLRTDM